VFLKSIELFGFKSFPDKTRIDFQNGISVILGPNGCGKSNIVDAVKWVVGEQSTKTLRAEKMEDVIFNGTENRKPLNVAEVTLILSNDAGILPLDRPEISLKRRLYRSGESEYFINRNLVRLREMRALFYDTGIGKSAYSVIEQGEIDRILSTKPEDRRYIFEEAAGITKYNTRRVEAERKLQKTEENIKQITTILAEVRRNHASLKVQSEKTEVYRRLRDDIFENEVQIQLLNLKDFAQKREKKEAELGTQNRKHEGLQSEIDGINSAMQKSIDRVNTMEGELIEVQKKLYGIDIQRNNRDSQIKILQERIAELQKKMQDDELREQGAEVKLEALRSDLEKRNEALQKTFKEREEIEKNIEGFQRDIQHFNQMITSNETTIRENEEKIQTLEGEIEKLRLDLREITDDIVTQLDQRLKDIGYSHKERQRVEEGIEEQLKSIRIQIEGRSAILEDARAITGVKGSDLQQILDAASDLLSTIKERLSTLASLYEEYKRTTPTFLDEFLAPMGIITRKRQIDTDLGQAGLTITALREANEKIRDEIRKLIDRINEYRKTLEELRVNKARMEAQTTAVLEEQMRLEREIKEQEDFLKKNREEMRETRKSIEEITFRIQSLKDELAELTREEDELKQRLESLEKDISKKNNSFMLQEEKVKGRMKKLQGVKNSLEALQIELAEIKTNISNIYQNFTERYSRDLSDFESREVEKPLRELQRSLAVHREKLRNLGQVNLMAPEEFKEVNQRYVFLEGQLKDLQQAWGDLKKITDEIKKESADLFNEAYDRIRKNFHIMVRRLFGGGRAELRLVGGDDVLESGIDILAQPPGKRLESIALLSGGERALTAVALLFAIYLARPSPFCILDEIDAALDEQNVGRFVDVLREFADNTQFVVVTHNKRTIVGAETLLGITMEESGVSKIIATRLKPDESKN
jgi:chromosome segregation protein